jgi:hypothetical protein
MYLTGKVAAEALKTAIFHEFYDNFADVCLALIVIYRNQMIVAENKKEADWNYEQITRVIKALAIFNKSESKDQAIDDLLLAGLDDFSSALFRIDYSILLKEVPSDV